MTRLRAAAVLAALACLGTLAGCGGEAPRPSVLLVTIDTLRADAVSAWGVEADTTPRLDALAAAGARFAQATTVTPLTLPAHASLLTGWRPGRHGLTVNGVARPELPVETLAEHLGAAGHDTAAFVSAAVLQRRHGLDAGFDLYDDDLHHPGGPPRPTERRGDRTVDRALEWLGEPARDAPWFAWVHLFDPHAPYAAPFRAGGEDRAAYLDEVRWTDEQVGRLLDGLPPGPVLVIVTSDHGESLGEHGEATHGVLIYESTMHVPLVAAWLDVGEDGTTAAATDAADEQPFAPGTVREDVVSLLDVAPTVLDLLELPPVEDADGRSFARPLGPRPLPLECRSPTFYYGFSPLVGVRRGATKVLGAPEADPPGWERFDLDGDPGELRPTPGADDPLVPLAPDPVPEDEALVVTDLDTLRALGYVGASLPSAGGPRGDPRQAMDLVDALDAANTELVQGHAATAWGVLSALGDRHDEVSELRYMRGRVLRALGRPAEAAAELAAGHALQPGSATLLVEWARALLEQAAAEGGDPEGAVTACRKALELVPGDGEALAVWALADLQAGRAAEALARVDEALAREPAAVHLLMVRLRALGALGRDAEAAAVRAQLQSLAPGLALPP